MCIKGLVISFVSRLSLWHWSRRFERTLKFFTRRYCRFTESNYLYHRGGCYWLVYHKPRSCLVSFDPKHCWHCEGRKMFPLWLRRHDQYQSDYCKTNDKPKPFIPKKCFSFLMSIWNCIFLGYLSFFTLNLPNSSVSIMQRASCITTHTSAHQSWIVTNMLCIHLTVLHLTECSRIFLSFREIYLS